MKLMNCPFCGSEAVKFLWSTNDGEDIYWVVGCKNSNILKIFYKEQDVGNGSCHMAGMSTEDNELMAVAIWNTRAPTAAEKELEEIKLALDVVATIDLDSASAGVYALLEIYEEMTRGMLLMSVKLEQAKGWIAPFARNWDDMDDHWVLDENGNAVDAMPAEWANPKGGEDA